MKHALFAFLCCPDLLAQPARADGVIQIPVSVKLIVDPETGEGPLGVSSFDITFAINNVNARLTEYSRGYRLVLVDPVDLVGVQFETARPFPGHYYSSSITSLPRLEMESGATANPQLWAWNLGAINIYINESPLFQGLLCTHPESQILVIDDFHANAQSAYVHMLGHYFGLCNTQGYGCNCCDGDEVCGTEPGSDGYLNTLPDRPCWDRDEIAQHNFGVDYNQLSSAQQNDVDNALFNVMSYHSAIQNCGINNASFAGRLTENRLDRCADAAGDERNDVCVGRTYFVRAGGGDIVMIHGGVYPENLTISEPVTLRTPRGSTARIGD